MPDDDLPRSPRALFARGSWAETSRISAILRKETVGGALLLLATVVALVWANSPWSASYTALGDLRVGTDALGLHLDLSLRTWAADGLLAIFFFIVGLELKREFVAGDLRDPARAALPIAAAVGGMIVPAAIFVALTAHVGDGAVRGWAIPTATDIAFAVAVLAVISTHLPSALRTFLLTLAVVDDLLAITVIAVFYTDHIDVVALAAAVVPLSLFALCVQRRIRSWWLLLPLAFLAWVAVHQSGIHATVAGVLLGFTVPVLRSAAAGGPDAGPGLAEHFEHRTRPLSAGVAVPVFAFFAAGVSVGGFAGLTTALGDPIALGIVCALVVGKPVGVFATTRLLAAATRASLDAALRWIDVFGIALLAGIGFTVSLLIGDLAYGMDSGRDDHVKIGVLTGSVAAAVLASVVLSLRNRHYRAVCAEESQDDDHDGIPDVYESHRD
ncbi:Na(+)/H(+) antiporter NhaA [Mycolicibacterium madagascariense]|uniref:Na(+)/H(+) antiporter NhaA n=1 Tax=Mycolicibacterium madagascariense TaxID=212765 RepID=A0A7I7XLQ3_9MYCO|nr:Na+/H+ antiporter NhaA [Mycolicibacterium madagascariense]BBZ30146.1 Na(+)/H(+) antiporter NhaA [Mycolicibacterium madagascariense]